MPNLSLSSAPRMPDRASLQLQPALELAEFTASSESRQILTQLRASIAVGLNLDAVLQRIADAAQLLTVANGAAIALQQDKWIICRARAGDMAPDLSSRVDKSSGISGECLRSGKALCCDDAWDDPRVDAEACRRLGLRSLAAAPIGEDPNRCGILEVFSAQPDAFGDSEVRLLEELAGLVSTALQDKKPIPLREKLAKTPLSFSKGKLIAAGFVVVALTAWVRVKELPKHPNSAQPLILHSTPADTDFSPPQRILVGEADTKTKPPAGVVMTSKTATDALIAQPLSETASSPDTQLLKIPAPHSQPRQSSDQSTPIPPPVTMISISSDKEISGLLSASSVIPQQSVRMSQGISGGTLEDKVNPVYPAAALMERRQGQVTLDGVVTEDGRVHDLKVVKGDPLLALAAMQAVSQWRYQPYKLNGEPIKRAISITLIFKLP